MQLNHLRAKTNFRRGQRIGRGGKRGTTSGRGTKGQKARAGHKIRPAIRDIIKKLPKLRGYKFKSFRPGPTILNLKDLDKHLESGEVISPEVLLKKGLLHKIKGRVPKVKILGSGQTQKRFVFKNVELSRSVRERME